MPDTLWTRTYGGPDEEDCRQVIEYLGGYVIGGRTRSYGAGNVDVYVIRVDAAGDTVWTRTFGTPFNDGGAALCPTADSCLCVSYTSAFNTGNPDGHLVKLNPAGAALWSKTYGGPTGEAVYSIVQAPGSGYVLCGSARGDAFLLRVNADGDTVWIRYYGGSAADAGYAVRACPDGGFAFCGATDSYGSGGSDAWLVKTDSLGNLGWSKTYGGLHDDIAWQFEASSDAGYCLVGETWSFGSGAPDYGDLYLVKTGPQGDTSWTRNYGGPMGDGGYSLLGSSGSRTLVCGWTESGGFGAADLWLLELNDSGDTLSARVYGGPADDQGNWVLAAPDSGYLISGTTGSFGQGGKDIWLLKTAADTLAVCEIREPRALNLTAYPNPFRTSTNIRWTMDDGRKTKQSLTMSIHDISGKMIYGAVSSFPLPAFDLHWSGTDQNGQPVPDGIYFLVGRIDRRSGSIKLILCR